MPQMRLRIGPRSVALLAEGVDRNRLRVRAQTCCRVVALLAEGVDRNRTDLTFALIRVKVALLAEGVDRNVLKSTRATLCPGRPPRGGRG